MRCLPSALLTLSDLKSLYTDCVRRKHVETSSSTASRREITTLKMELQQIMKVVLIIV